MKILTCDSLNEAAKMVSINKSLTQCVEIYWRKIRAFLLANLIVEVFLKLEIRKESI